VRTRGYTGSTEVVRIRGAMKIQCQHRRPDGRKCHANAMARSGFCFFHDPKRATERLEAQRAGGLRNKAASLPLDTPDHDVKNAGDIVALLGLTLNQVRKGQIDPRLANSVGYISGILLKALEVETLEQRVSALERATTNQPLIGSVLDTEEFQFIQRPPDDQREATGAN
jgi:hypothetical protein